MGKLLQRRFSLYSIASCVLVIMVLIFNTHSSRTRIDRTLKCTNREATAQASSTRELSSRDYSQIDIIGQHSHKYNHDMTQTIPFFRPLNRTLPSVIANNVTSNKFNVMKIIHHPTLVNNVDVNPEIIKYVQLSDKEPRDDLVNLHSYSYTISPQVCDSRKPFLVILVHSAPDHYHKRTLIRSTFGSVKQYKNRNITVVFLIGAVESELLQEALNDEAELYGDIVQGKFVDSYRALLKKHIMGMHWYFSHCKSDYIIKIDDDTFLNPYRLIEFLIEKKPSNGVWCRPGTGYNPIRKTTSKYYTPVAQYPFRKLPQFCLGFAYITTPDIWNKLYRESATTRMMNMDDVYVGILSLKAGVQIVRMDDLLFNCNVKYRNLQKLKQKPFFFDPWGKCGNRPFLYWRSLVEPG